MKEFNIFALALFYHLLMNHLREKHPLLKTRKMACYA